MKTNVIPFPNRFQGRTPIQDRTPSFESDQPQAFEFNGDSMAERGLSNGDVMLCYPVSSRAEIDGKVCIIVHNGQLVARTVKLQSKNRATLIAANPKYSNIKVNLNAVKVVGVVRRIMKEI